MNDSFDCIVIGGGSAGYAAARTAVGHGLRTAVVDGAAELGGLCILRGCMPSKTLLESANRFHSMRRADEFGLRADNLRVVPEEIRARKRRLIAEFADYRVGQLEDGRFTLFRGQAVFRSPHEVVVEGPDLPETILQGKSFILATGSKVALPAVPGLARETILTSDDVLDAGSLPDSLIVLGGGPIALELAWYHHALGVPTTVIQRSPRLVRSVDADAAKALEDAMVAEGMTIHTDTKLRALTRENGVTTVHFDHHGKPATAHAAAVLCALGRDPASGWLGLDAAGVALDGLRIRTDAGQATNQSHIFAAGDVCGPHEIVHIAISQGENAATNAAVHLGKLPRSAWRETDYRLKLFAMFTQPELATVGLGEDEADGREVIVASYPFNDHGKSMVMGETSGFVKLVADARSGEILGGTVVGPHASDLIHEVVVAMAFRSTCAQFAAIPHYHPTLAEIWTYPAEELTERLPELSS